MKSRTVIGRTIARVRTRISSLGTPDSPNPLRAPPTIVLPSKPAGEPEVTTIDPLPLPMITAIRIETSTWTVFDTHPKYHATAYINVGISTLSQNAALLAEEKTLKNASGDLLDLEMTISVSGPAVKLTEYGCSTQKRLNIGQNWTNVIYIGIKDTSLASKLSTSLRSINDKTGGRLGRYTNIDLINKWLVVLQNDSDVEPIHVTATVNYRHSFLPKDTKLQTVACCKVVHNKDIEARKGDQALHVDEDEDEERLREARVYGAPWM